jgi:hypothetical protein
MVLKLASPGGEEHLATTIPGVKELLGVHAKSRGGLP